MNSFVDRSYENEKVKGMKKVAYQSELNKLKVAFSMLCIIDYEHEFMRKMLKCLDINRLDQVYADVKDKGFLKELDMRVRYLIESLKTVKENLQEKVIIEVKADGERDDELYWRNLSGLKKRFSDEEIAILESSMRRKKQYKPDEKKKL